MKNGHRISLNITDFVLEIPFVLGNKKCKFDYLEIRDGGYVSSPLIGRFCGTDIPRQILSQSNNLYLEFGSDNLDSGKGFQIYWDGSIKGKLCSILQFYYWILFIILPVICVKFFIKCSLSRSLENGSTRKIMIIS